MKIQRNKALVICLVLVLTMAAMLVALPVANAQPPPVFIEGKKKSFAYIGAVPNPVGKGQQVLLHVGITQQLNYVADSWKGLWVTIEKPDDTTDTIDDITTDSTGGTGVVFTPDQVGTYYLQTHFPAQWYNSSYFDLGTMIFYIANIFYEASVSEKLALEVQEDPVPYYPGLPPPAEYWTRPIDGQLREWSNISGSWLQGAGLFGGPPNKFAPYNDGPESPHILWTKPMGGSFGGLAGGEHGPHAFECGDAYEGKFGGSIIIGGVLYYHKFEGAGFGEDPATIQEVVAVDLHTGEELWCKTFLDGMRRISFGQLFYWDAFNYHGVFSYLVIQVGGAVMFGLGPTTPETWVFYDAQSGAWKFNMTDIPPGTNIYGPKGEIYRYTVNQTAGWMTLWNSSRVGIFGLDPMSQGSWGNSVRGKILNATNGIQWTATIPTDLEGSVVASFFGDRIFGANVNSTTVNTWALDVSPGNEGEELFNEVWTPPSIWEEGNVTVGGFGGGFSATSLEEKVAVMWVKELREHYAFSLEDGEYLWKTDPEMYLNIYGHDNVIVYGKLYSTGVSGILYCYDIETGDLLWTYEAVDPYQEILWNNNWWLQILFVTDGKIYLGHSEHSPIDPKPRGAPFICLNATNGDVIFRADGLFRQTHWGGTAIIGDSIIATQDSYDQRVYAIGKGPSAIEISTSPTVICNGDSVLIQGRVTDESPGTKEYGLTARFPNGVPAIADEYMTEWMLYVYKQFPAPMDVTGVDVLLQAMSSNGTITDLGWVTSDGYGCFSFMWTPPDEDVYTIMAIFLGSKAYWPSYTQTGVGVTAALEEPAEPAYLTIDLAIIAAVVVAIVIGIVNLYALRKRK